MEMMEYSLEDKGQTKNQRLIETSIDENKGFFFFQVGGSSNRAII